MRWLVVVWLCGCGGAAVPGPHGDPDMPTPAQDQPPPTDPHRLFQAAATLARRGDVDLVLRAERRLGLIDDANRVSTAMAPFRAAHVHWAQDNGEWMLALASDPDRAREYLMDRLGVPGHRLTRDQRRHRLYFAATAAGDPALLAEVEDRLGFRAGGPAVGAFQRAHARWATADAAFAHSVGEPSAAHAYLVIHDDELATP